MKHLNQLMHRSGRKPLFISLILALLSCPLLALENDRQQPIEIEANAATFDEKKGTSTYTGNVKVTQGSIRLWSQKLTVYSLRGEMEKMIATGEPVKFRQTPSLQKEDINGTALRMEFYGNQSKVIMLKKAKLWQGKNSTSSERIEYDSLNAVIQAGKKSSSSQRVKVILMPSKK
jgi:lipopolysaccharide export system protein LptA